MSEAKFKTGDRVVAKNYLGIEGVVADSMHSIITGWTYVVDADNGANFYFREDDLELIPPKKDYSVDIKIDIANNVVIATLYESDGALNVPIKKGHGHLIHEGAFGIAQAASYACYRLYKDVGGNKE